jgi:hypothetical protein
MNFNLQLLEKEQKQLTDRLYDLKKNIICNKVYILKDYYRNKCSNLSCDVNIYTSMRSARGAYVEKLREHKDSFIDDYEIEKLKDIDHCIDCDVNTFYKYDNDDYIHIIEIEELYIE